ncbi:MAG: ATPase [Firmicutes bacterium]|nr:ATPase [Bacillota bacterium]
MRYVLGVDGGGSQTTAVVADELGFPLGWGKAGGANHQSVGIDQAIDQVWRAASDALRVAQLTPEAIALAHYGLAGADRPHDFAILKPALQTLPFAVWDVTADAWIGLRAGTSDYVGVSLVCGSGTNAVGRDPAGHEVQIGGFGYAFGDTAGGHHLAVETFRAAVRAYQRRGPETLLTHWVPMHLGMSDMEAVYNTWLDTGRAIPLSLALVAHQAADAGDAVARRLLREMGEELGRAANAVLAHLDVWAGPIEVVLVGSIVQKGKHLEVLGGCELTIRQQYPQAVLRPLAEQPVYGAVLMALDAIKARPDPRAAQHYQIQEVRQ